MKYCKKCGSELSDDSKFCSNCGEPVSDDFSSDGYTPSYSKKETFKSEPTGDFPKNDEGYYYKKDYSKASIICGIIGITVPYVGMVTAISAVIFGCLVIKKKSGKTGLILGIVGIILQIAYIAGIIR